MNRFTSLFPFLAFLFAACTPDTPIPSISPQETEGLLRNDFAVLVDVREVRELKEGRAAAADNLPLSRIEAKDKLWQLWTQSASKSKDIVVYSSTPESALKAAKALRAAGFKVKTLGTFEDWKKAGMPVK